MIVAVYGSALPPSNTALYKQANELGRLLATAGHAVMTGGYTGVMEAVSRGASEAGGKTIGVTCADIDAWRPGGANQWVQVVIHTENLNKRLETLTRQPDAMIALPGGIGTLGEISLVLNLIAVKSLTPRPIILVGKMWKECFDGILNTCRAFIREGDLGLLSYAEDNQAAIALLEKFNSK